MRYFKSQNNQVFAYDEDQIAAGYGADMTPMTAEEIEAHLNPTPTLEQLAAIERYWRDGELERADIELNKVQDGMGIGTVSVWREYRCALRNWPESEFFPDSSKRPVAPDVSLASSVVE